MVWVSIKTGFLMVRQRAQAIYSVAAPPLHCMRPLRMRPRFVPEIDEIVMAASESIGVFARLKPVGSEVRGEVSVPTAYGKQKNVQVRNIEFSLDWIFTESEPQEKVYDIAARARVDAVLDGFNATIVAYGQTGSGKTHTMFGPDEVLTDFTGCDPAAHGIVPRATNHLFEGVDKGDESSTFIVQCSYLEVYNNALNDLLGGKQNLQMRESSVAGLVVEGLSYVMVSSSEGSQWPIITHVRPLVIS